MKFFVQKRKKIDFFVVALIVLMSSGVGQLCAVESSEQKAVSEPSVNSVAAPEASATTVTVESGGNQASVSQTSTEDQLKKTDDTLDAALKAIDTEEDEFDASDLG